MISTVGRSDDSTIQKPGRQIISIARNRVMTWASE
jgi:hypothetical protein